MPYIPVPNDDSDDDYAFTYIYTSSPSSSSSSSNNDDEDPPPPHIDMCWYCGAALAPVYAAYYSARYPGSFLCPDCLFPN
jgi:hypothetical protein